MKSFSQKAPPDLLHDPLLPSLLSFTFPILCSMLLQLTYGTVDLMIVGNFSSTGDLAGVTIGSQVMTTVTNLFCGLAMGSTILIGQSLGANSPKKASQVLGQSIALFTLLALLSTALLLALAKPIAQLMNTPESAWEPCVSYLNISASGTLFLVSFNLLGSLFRAIGDGKTPLYAVAIACVVNIVLDLLLVGLFHLGATGAALATVIAQGCSVALCLWSLRKKPLPFPWEPKSWQSLSHWKNILSLGCPVALQSVLVSLSFLVITSIVNVFGEASSAGVGVVEKITGLTMLVPLSFMQSLSVFTAQNMGAGQSSRSQKALFLGIGTSLLFALGMAYISWFHGELLTQFFLKNEPLATKSALEYLRSYAFDTIFVCFIFCFTGYFNGCGKTKFVMFQGVFGACCLRIPLAYYLASLENSNLFLIGLATPASTLVQIVMFLLYYLWEKRKDNATYGANI